MKHWRAVRSEWLGSCFGALLFIGLAILAASAVSVVWSAAPRVSAPLVRFTSDREFGNITYSAAYVGSFAADLELRGLRPQAVYALTLNGKPNQPGNDELMRIGTTRVTSGVKEAHLDFQMIRAGSDGRFKGQTVAVPLPPGRYDLKFFVKDVEQGFRVVLGLDVLQFSVHPAPVRGQAQIRITRIVPNGHIEGTVTGLPGDYKKYKVLVYVKTDEWYIHPFTHGGDGYSFAMINPDGTWKIRTVKREFAAEEVVALVVDVGYHAPASLNDIGRVEAIATYSESGEGRL